LELSTSRVRTKFSEAGEIVSLVIDGRELGGGSPLHRLVLYPDFPHQFDAWDIDRQTLHLGELVTTAVELTDWQPESGAAGLAFRRRVGQSSSAEIRFQVDERHPVLHCEILLDWHEENVLLKAHFPTDFGGSMARFGSPFNSVLRGQLPGETKNEAMFEVCGSRWAVVMDDAQTAGLGLVTEAKFGFSCRNGDLALTLLRSVPVTGEDVFLQKVMTKALRDGGVRGHFSDQGRHHIRYAVCAFQGNLPREENPAALAELLYAPRLRGAVARQAGFLGLEGGESLVPCWARPLGDGAWTLRLHETLGRAGAAVPRLADGWQAVRVNLAESEIGPPLAPGDPLIFRPYEIVSLRLTPPSP
jgi:alpha-mannosidase